MGRWIFYHVPTYKSYAHEISYKNSVLSKTSKDVLKASIFTTQSTKFPKTHKQILLILFKLTDKKDYEAGVIFSLLMKKCQDVSITLNEKVLSNIIKELLNQGVIKKRKNKDNITLLFCRSTKSRKKNFSVIIH